MENEEREMPDDASSQFALSSNQIGQDELHLPDEIWEDTDPRPSAQKSLDDYQQQLEAKRKRPKRR